VACLSASRPYPVSAPDAGFWLRYWNTAYGHALEQRAGNVLFVDFDKLLEERDNALGRLAEALTLTERSKLAAAGSARSDDAARRSRRLFGRRSPCCAGYSCAVEGARHMTRALARSMS
jgi:hypothetical protein